MKTHIGSLQKRGNRYYLVLREKRHQRWIALKTAKLPLARARAAKIAPRDADDESAWLNQLVREGERARELLFRRQVQRELTWDNLAERCASTVDADASAENRACHARWLAHAACHALKTKTGQRPDSLSSGDAEIVIREIASRCLSAARMTTYFRRVWTTLGLGQDIWPRRRFALRAQESRPSEHYRRLTVDEVRTLHAFLCGRSQPLADMVLIGYSTGLRLSDVAELEIGETLPPFLRVCPNKTRRHKPYPLKIPLTAPAQRTVSRLKQAAEAKGERYLFDEPFRKRPSRKLTPSFKACGIEKAGAGRASFHSLRATFISLMDEAGIPPHVTDAITGHGGGGMHARYTQPSDEALLSAVAKALPDL